jgi:trans-aconitate methyltransferase
MLHLACKRAVQQYTWTQAAAAFHTATALQAWDPSQYLRFADHRARPGMELLARIDHASPASVVDLGCGPGNLTAHLAHRWPHADVTGVDSSDAMLSRAAEQYPSIRWLQVCTSADMIVRTCTHSIALQFDALQAIATLGSAQHLHLARKPSQPATTSYVEFAT